MWDKQLKEALRQDTPNQALVLALIQDGADLNAIEEIAKRYLDTPISWAIVAQHVALARDMIALPQYRFVGNTVLALIAAIGANQPEFIDLLLKDGNPENVSLEHWMENKKSALRLAIEKDMNSVVQTLMDHGANPNYINPFAENNTDEKKSPLHYAVEKNKLAVAEAIITHPKFVFNDSSAEVLSLAIQKKLTDIVFFLINAKNKNTPGYVPLVRLRQAILNGSLEQVMNSIAAGEDVNGVTNAFAMQKHKAGSEILSLLMSSPKFNFDIDKLLERLEKGEANFLAPLMEYGIDSLLSAAAKKGYNNALRLLLAEGLDPNQTITIDGISWTPLLQAIYAKKIEAAMMMVNSKQFVYTPHRGGAALMIANGKGYVEQCGDLILALTEKKSLYEHERDLEKQKQRQEAEDALWAALGNGDDDEPAAPVPAPVVTTTTAREAKLTFIAPQVKKSETQPERQENKDMHLYKKGGIYEL